MTVCLIAFAITVVFTLYCCCVVAAKANRIAENIKRRK